MAAKRLNRAGIVLVGGTSSRMGVDKATLVVDGEAMAERAVRALSETGISNVAVAGSAELPDPTAKALGPMAGIVSGWDHLKTTAKHPIDTVVVLACDLPAIRSEIVRKLLHSAAGHEHGAVAHDGDRAQPLIAAYRRPALESLVVAFARGERSVRRCFGEWDLGKVSFDRAALADADSPADLQGFSVQWPQQG